MPQATPGARRLAKELDVDLEKVAGTGKKGYILVGDVQDYEQEAPPPFDHEMNEEFDGEVYPVSEIYKMRFRQDDPATGELIGEDLIGIRPKAVGGRFRSSAGILGFFVADRGYFVNGTEVVPEPEPEPKKEPEKEAEGFAVSE